MAPFQFPINDVFQARVATSPRFDITPMAEELVQDLHQVRSHYWRDRVLFCLNLDQEGKLHPTGDYSRIVLTGYLGVGKSIELFRLREFLCHPQRYFTVNLDLNKVFSSSAFRAEDFFAAMIMGLTRAIQEAGHPSLSPALENLASTILSPTGVMEELRDTYDLDSAEGLSYTEALAALLAHEHALKAAMAADSLLSASFRNTVRANPYDLVKLINLALSEARIWLESQNLGKDFLFMVDISHKIPPTERKRLVREYSEILDSLQANLLMALPMDTGFYINSHPAKESFLVYELPLVRISPENVEILKKILTLRIDEKCFFDEEALSYAIWMSGGIPGQLVRIANHALISNLGQTITMEVIQNAVRELGSEMLARLDSKHLKIVTTASFDAADPKVLELMAMSVVLKYNGYREINPLIREVLG